METDKQLFHKNPNINPETGKHIKIGGQTYNKLTSKYGIPKIKSPKTGQPIAVGKIAYKKLINQGYTEQQLLTPYYENLKSKEPPTNIPLLYEHSDILFNIMLNSPIDTIKSICLTQKDNQWCYNNFYWIEKFKHDQLTLIEPYPTTLNNWIKEYKKMDEIKNVIQEGIKVVNSGKYYVIDVMYKNKQDVYDVFGAYYPEYYPNNIIPILLEKNAVSLVIMGYQVDVIKRIKFNHEFEMTDFLTHLLYIMRYVDHKIYK